MDETVPALERVRDDVWSLAMPMPRGHIRYSLLSLLRDSDGGLHIVDPGWDTDENWTRFVDAITGIGASLTDIRSLVSTHLHPDHLGMAERIRAATGAPLRLHAADQDALDAQQKNPWTDESVARQLDEWGVPVERRDGLAEFASNAPTSRWVTADSTLADGERLDIPGFDLTVEWTPGHTPGSICLRDDARAILLTGDHVLPTMHAGLGLGGNTANNALADYLGALERVSALADHEVLPGHGYRFTGLAERAHAHAEHHLRRTSEVRAVLAGHGELSTWDIATQLSWTAGWENLRGFFVFSALSQTAMHRDYARGTRGVE
jgi:glyoxylase-like metal-dependent hydrolase (beta-lactamase superfamily II)